ELQLQFPPAIYRTWVDGARLAGCNASTSTAYVIVENNYIQDWLQNRLYTTIQRSLARISRIPDVRIEFVVEEVPEYAARAAD
ncbi:MAG: hypothetical protein K8I82_06185, partial [Anaerolineae bacterium]|nr:hypothetical protein [Anaerolineae bacterium]